MSSVDSALESVCLICETPGRYSAAGRRRPDDETGEVEEARLGDVARLGRRGSASWRPTGAPLKSRTLLFALSPYPAGAGGGITTKRRAYSRPCMAQSDRLPHRSMGRSWPGLGTTEEQSDPQPGDGCAARMNNMDVGRPGRPSPSASAIGSGAVGSPEGTERLASRWRARRRSRDARKSIQDDGRQNRRELGKGSRG